MKSNPQLLLGNSINISIIWYCIAIHKRNKRVILQLNNWKIAAKPFYIQEHGLLLDKQIPKKISQMNHFEQNYSLRKDILYKAMKLKYRIEKYITHRKRNANGFTD